MMLFCEFVFESRTVFVTSGPVLVQLTLNQSPTTLLSTALAQASVVIVTQIITQIMELRAGRHRKCLFGRLFGHWFVCHWMEVV